ncbi:unnamed protein product [Caenorhabditis auriculariae]|uniref:Vacuolar-sorting protein SNF8 n=1 Tax=Caenorhabditis auriculariae TaxID=2777116 RepID=A0A8S1GWI8_9PELO|nr:unnamed protein product [Caenorhabditis auriculariae]
MSSNISLLVSFSICIFLISAFCDEEINDYGWKTNLVDVVPQQKEICNIEIHDAKDLSTREFLRRYAFSEPVIIKNIENDEFRRLTSRDEMIKNWSNEKVTLNSANTYSYTRVETSLKNLDILGNETLYLFGDIDQRTWASLLDEYKKTEMGTSWTFPSAQFWLSWSRNCKRWFLYPFEKRPNFNPDKTTLEWYLKDYPKLQREDLPLECVLKPGEVIYFPDKWWHATLNIELTMASRRRIGVGAVQKKQETATKFAAKGEKLAGDQLQQFSQQLDQLAQGLEMFAHRHRDEIRKNSQFRRHFQEMCASVGVDPLASSKGFWAKALGFGDFYYELGIQIVEICLSTTHINGGIMTVEEIRNRLMRTRSRTRKETISFDDILRAVEKLKVLGGGFELVPLGGGRFLVQSIPGELSMDHSRVLQLAEDTAYVTLELIMDRLRWDEARAQSVLDYLVKEGLAWIDSQASDTTQYWVPSLFLQQYCHSSSSTSVSESIKSVAIY